MSRASFMNRVKKAMTGGDNELKRRRSDGDHNHDNENNNNNETKSENKSADKKGKNDAKKNSPDKKIINKGTTVKQRLLKTIRERKLKAWEQQGELSFLESCELAAAEIKQSLHIDSYGKSMTEGYPSIFAVLFLFLVLFCLWSLFPHAFPKDSLSTSALALKEDEPVKNILARSMQDLFRNWLGAHFRIVIRLLCATIQVGFMLGFWWRYKKDIAKGALLSASFTIFHFGLSAFRQVLCIYLYLKSSNNTTWLSEVAALLWYPLYAHHCIIFFLWWFIVTPVIFWHLRTVKDAKKDAGDCSRFTDAQWDFLEWNFSPSFLLLHCFNFFPLVLLDHYIDWRPLVFRDLYMSCFLLAAYGIFYYFVLDGYFKLQYYVIISPRHWWGACLMALGFYIEIYMWEDLSRQSAAPLYDLLRSYSWPVYDFWVSYSTPVFSFLAFHLAPYYDPWIEYLLPYYKIAAIHCEIWILYITLLCRLGWAYVTLYWQYCRLYFYQALRGVTWDYVYELFAKALSSTLATDFSTTIYNI